MALAILLVVGASACGRSDAEEERAFRGEATALCDAYLADVLEVPLPTSGAEYETFVERLGARERRLFADLGELEAPPRLRTRFERAVRSRSQSKAYEDLVALDLDRCVNTGVAAERGATVTAEVIDAGCSTARRQLARDLEEEPLARRPTAAAINLDALARALEADVVVPRRTQRLWRAAIGEMTSTARALRRARRTSAELERRALATELETSIVRGLAAWTLVGVQSCVDVYSTLSGVEPG